MGKAVKEKTYTQEQLQKKVNRIRGMMAFVMSFSDKVLRKPKVITGKELYPDTQAGKVKVLTYNMDNDEILPLFVNIHGSGFTIGDAGMDDPFMMNIAVNANVKIISIDYSLAPEAPFPVALNECYAVVKYAKEHPEEFGIDPDRIAVGGQSAGGNFTAGIGLMEGDENALGIKCLILDYPPLDVYTDAGQKPHPKGSIPNFMSRMFDACYCNNKEERKNPLISPVYATADQVRAFPPTLVITASRDSLCEEGEKFRDKLIDAGVDVTHKRFDAMHGFNLKPGPVADASWQLIIDFLNRYLWER
jgi:acetyl esterase